MSCCQPTAHWHLECEFNNCGACSVYRVVVVYPSALEAPAQRAENPVKVLHSHISSRFLHEPRQGSTQFTDVSGLDQPKNLPIPSIIGRVMNLVVTRINLLAVD